MNYLPISDLNFCQVLDTDKDLITGGATVQKVPTFSASTQVSLATKVTFVASVNYKTGADYSGSAGYAGGYAVAASINGDSVAFVEVSVQ